MQNCYQNKPKFNSTYLRNSEHKMKDGTYVRNLDEHKSIGIHSIALYVNYNVNYFDDFGVENIPKEINKIHRKNIEYNIEYKLIVQLCVDIFVLDLLILS